MKKAYLLLCFLAPGLYAQVALSVTTVTLKKETLTRTIPATGNIAARQIVEVNAQTAGAPLVSINAELGQSVTKGQILAQFDDTLLRQNLLIAKAHLDAAEIALRQATRNAARAKTLESSHALSTQNIEQLQAARQNAQSQRDAARAAYAIQQYQFAKATVRAPQAGVISAKTATLGAVTGVGSPLFRIMVNGALSWEALVSQDDIAAVHIGSEARLQLGHGQSVRGFVYNIAPTVEAGSRQVRVWVSLESNPYLRAGMLLSGEFLAAPQNVWTAPIAAIARREEGACAWTVDAKAVVHCLPVRLGARRGARVVVYSGLTPQTPLIARGGGFLHDGDTVRVIQEAAQP